MWRFWYLRAHAEEGINLLSHALSDVDTAILLDELEDVPLQTVDAIRVRALQGIARLSYSLSRTSNARTYCQEGIRTADRCGMTAAATELRATLLVGYEHSARDLGSSEQIAKMGIDAAEARLLQADRSGAAILWSRSAGLLIQAGALEAALACTEREVLMRSELKDRPGEQEALERAILLRKQLGKQAENAEAERASELALSIGISERIAASYAEIGLLAALQGDFPEAREQLENSMSTLREDPDSPAIWWINEALARTALQQNDLQASAAWLTELAAEYAAHEDVAGQRSVFALFAELAARIGRSEMAAIFMGLARTNIDSDNIRNSQSVLGEERWNDIIARAESGMVSFGAASAMACSLAADIHTPLHG